MSNKTISTNVPLYDRDLSWLSFNYRVLCMAKSEDVPLYERIKFLSIFSSNLDEFFRVRMPAVLTVNKLLHRNPDVAGEDILSPDTLPAIQQEINRQLGEFGRTLTGKLLPALKSYNIHLYYNEPLHTLHLEPLREYFLTKVLSFLQPLWLRKKKPEEVFLENNQLYLVVSLTEDTTPDMQQYALVNIPSASLPRFIELPALDNVYYIAMLDDVIRENVGFLFPGYTVTGCYSIKITRDAETDMNELASDILEQVETMIQKRELGIPTRFLFDATMPLALQKLLAVYFHILPEEMVEGGRYHNLKDLNDLPMPVKSPAFSYPKQPSIQVPALENVSRLLDEVAKRDILLHAPYQRYDYILRFFNEAAVDPNVQEIYITLYRIASSSQIANALISAAHNGKQVTVFVELKARFDEANNIRWAKKMKAAGVKIIYSIPGLKVHAKIALVKRRRGYQWDYAGLMATGNFNETTARFYTDHVMMTAHPGITQELELLFLYLQAREQPVKYKFLTFQHLLVAQFNMMDRFKELINREIENARTGKPARIIIKLNNLQEKEMIASLYAASQEGVTVDLIARSICCLVPDQPESSNIRVRRIVDRYLEHARVFIFHNNGNEEVYMGSADWMNRNLHRRIEVVFPVYDPQLQAQLKEIIRLQLADNTNAVKLDAEIRNIDIAPEEGVPRVNAQQAIYQYIQSL
ncbi:polyphosphate kinase 1 [Chitinophaga ginsengisoli]|uniref:Polyphosphate kinase n=1 Tax=Chitinophaga ginsengisoli TaxID=363837 RepID=A0A2P8FCV9_9BACT|nr:polyphosphate kinase 1 [Chitinophaga ginsengisoli]PSL19544.1 polyphosphate kinase [Chitinophaga ginsengisoli]